MTQKLSVRFDLEQAIMRCWSITEDIDTLRNALCNDEVNEDQLDNYLLGLETIYNIKFQKAFDLFEQLLKEGK